MEAFKDWHVLTRAALVAATLSILFLVGTGCVTREVTTPPRSATEQLLLSSSADLAMSTAKLQMFSGHNVYVDFTYFDSYDSKYAEGEIRDALSRAGAKLAADEKSADIVVEARAGAYSIDTNSTFFGIPSIPLPIPTTSETPITPAIAFYQKQEQISYAKIALLAYGKDTRAHIYSSGSLDGKSYNSYHSLLFVSWWRSNIPERNEKKNRAKYIVWTPEYDPQNMPPAPPPPHDH